MFPKTWIFVLSISGLITLWIIFGPQQEVDNIIVVPVNVSEKGNEIIISASIEKVLDVPITILVKNADGSLIRVDQIMLPEDGSFSFSILKEGPLWENVDRYSVKVQYANPSVKKIKDAPTMKFILPDLLPQAEARSFSAFTFDIDEKYHREGHVQFVVEKDSTNFLPVTIKPNWNASLTLHITTNFDQMGAPKLPKGINMYFEPSSFEIIKDEVIPVKIFIIVDDKTPTSLYDVQIVGNWTNPDGSTDFMGSSFRLHVGKDFGEGKIPANFNLGKIKQFFEDGVPIQEIPCKIDYVIIIKKSTGYPACVSPETKDKLIKMGWAKTDGKQSFEIISSDSKSATFYVQPSLTSAILKNDGTIRIHLFSYMKDLSGSWDQAFDSAFELVPKNYKIGIVEKSPNNISKFATSGIETLPDGMTAKISREEGYFVVYLTSNQSLNPGKYDLSILSVDNTGLIIEKPLHIIAVEETIEPAQDRVIRLNYGKGSWVITFENIPEQEYWIREDRRAPWPPVPILDISEDNIHPSVKELIDAMWRPNGKYVPSEYDNNVLIKEGVGIINVEPAKIRDWLKKIHDEQFERNLDDSFSHYIRYDDKIYSFGFIAVD